MIRGKVEEALEVRLSLPGSKRARPPSEECKCPFRGPDRNFREPGVHHLRQNLSSPRSLSVHPCLRLLSLHKGRPKIRCRRWHSTLHPMPRRSLLIHLVGHRCSQCSAFSGAGPDGIPRGSIAAWTHACMTTPRPVGTRPMPPCARCGPGRLHLRPCAAIDACADHTGAAAIERVRLNNRPACVGAWVIRIGAIRPRRSRAMALWPRPGTAQAPG